MHCQPTHSQPTEVRVHRPEKSNTSKSTPGLVVNLRFDGTMDQKDIDEKKEQIAKAVEEAMKVGKPSSFCMLQETLVRLNLTECVHGSAIFFPKYALQKKLSVTKRTCILSSGIFTLFDRPVHILTDRLRYVNNKDTLQTDLIINNARCK